MAFGKIFYSKKTGKVIAALPFYSATLEMIMKYDEGVSRHLTDIAYVPREYAEIELERLREEYEVSSE